MNPGGQGMGRGRGYAPPPAYRLPNGQPGGIQAGLQGGLSVGLQPGLGAQQERRDIKQTLGFTGWSQVLPLLLIGCFSVSCLSDCLF